jgi:hypothetical protein
MNQQQSIAIFESQDGQSQVDVKFEEETVWLSQAQMVELFAKDVRTINEHIKISIKNKSL